jgi:hypothetical protein
MIERGGKSTDFLLTDNRLVDFLSYERQKSGKTSLLQKKNQSFGL